MHDSRVCDRSLTAIHVSHICFYVSSLSTSFPLVWKISFSDSKWRIRLRLRSFCETGNVVCCSSCSPSAAVNREWWNHAEEGTRRDRIKEEKRRPTYVAGSRNNKLQPPGEGDAGHPVAPPGEAPPVKPPALRRVCLLADDDADAATCGGNGAARRQHVCT